MSILNKLKIKKDPSTRINADGAQIKADDIRVNQRPPASASRAGEWRAGSNPRQSAILKQVWSSERANLILPYRKYIFAVDKKANKPEIKNAVEHNYGVKVSDINVINRTGKAKRLGRSMGRTPAFKKAIVTLKEGEKIRA